MSVWISHVFDSHCLSGCRTLAAASVNQRAALVDKEYESKARDQGALCNGVPVNAELPPGRVFQALPTYSSRGTVGGLVFGGFGEDSNHVDRGEAHGGGGGREGLGFDGRALSVADRVRSPAVAS